MKIHPYKIPAKSALATLFICSLITLVSCKKYLDERSSRSLVVPNTLDDLQAILDGTGGGIGSNLSDELADDYYVTTASWQSVYSSTSISTSNDALHYLWNGSAINLDLHWRQPYAAVYKSNVVIDALKAVGPQGEKWNNIKGAALFYRSFGFWNLAQNYCKPYSSSASTDPGIPLRSDPNPEVASFRSSVQATYDQIISDLQLAADLLPETSVSLYRPTKTAAFALLARSYLSMRDYPNAKRFADSALSRNNLLLNYNSLNSAAAKPVPVLNVETIYYDRVTANAQMVTDITYCVIDTNLYRSYDDNDLRKKIFFRQSGSTYYFQGSYSDQANTCFDGLATDEIYLIRAECSARAGDISAAMADLNNLLKTRWKSSVPYQNITSTNASDALDKVLIERRKELCFRALRWSDIRRLNLEGRNISLKRVVNNTSYNLLPNDLHWVVLIPQDVISYSGIQQNPR